MFRKKIVLGVAVGLAALSLLAQSAMADGGQSDPAWDYGRGGIGDGGIACYQPAPSVTFRKMYNIYRPACSGPGHMQ